MKQTKLSIITIVYNDRIGFEKTAASIKGQSAKEYFEWIVIDAMSTDGTFDVIQNYINEITHLVHEPDRGRYDGMNKGIALAQGKYLLFLNSGDSLYSNDVIKDVVADNDFGKFDIISGNIIFTRNNKPLWHVKSPEEITGKQIFKSGFLHPCTFIKTERLKKNGYDINYQIAADTKFFFQDLILNNATYKHIDLPITLFDATGISLTNNKLATEERERLLKETLPPRIYSDYYRFSYGKTTLERIIYKIDETDIIYKIITILAILVYSPIAVYNRIRMQCRKFYTQ